MKVIKNFDGIEKLFPLFDEFDCVVILAKYNCGKSSICTEKIHNQFGEENVYYATFVDQSKPNFTPRQSRLNFGEVVFNKIIVFDEISDDQSRDVKGYLKKLTKTNKLIILSNPYGASSEAKREAELFREQEKDILPEKVLFVYVLERI